MPKRHKNKQKAIFIVALVAAIAGLLTWYFSRHIVAVLSPAGTISAQEKHLIIIGLILSAVVVIPVYLMTIFIVLKYRESNHSAHYRPDWDHSLVFESIWWGIPLTIITILSVITWQSAHSLDPFKPLNSKTMPLTVQVVSLDWKWLFIYPQQNVASVNLVELPVNTPVDFNITSDTVMNSFWLPRLGGQIYAMPGMMTQLNLVANQTGTFTGSSANISGQGFAGMTFNAQVVSNNQFKSWVKGVKSSSPNLNLASYSALAQPTSYQPVSYYGQVSGNLFNSLVMKYMTPSGGQT